jgi:hypothetical protein
MTNTGASHARWLCLPVQGEPNMRKVLFWRRTDIEGLERLELDIGPDRIEAASAVICLESGGFRLEHRWLLGLDWRAQSVQVERWNADGHARLLLEREGTGWRVDGARRPDLDGAQEPDLSVTPFCNTFPSSGRLRLQGRAWAWTRPSSTGWR